MGLLRNLTYLQEVAKTKSINKAAENLYISKSALSVALKNLEEDFGIPLLNRSVHGASLTDAGEMVVERASLIFNILDGLRDECALYCECKQKLNFYTELSFANTILPAIITELKLFKANRYITTKSASLNEILDAVRESPENIGLFIANAWNGRIPDDDPIFKNLKFKRVTVSKLCVVTAKYSKYISLNIKELSYEDIKDIPQIELKTNIYKNDVRPWSSSMENSEHNYVMTTDNNNIYFQAILHDVGIGLMLDIGIPFGLADRRKLRFIPLKNSREVDLWMVFHEDSEENTIEELSEIIKCAVV